MANIEITGQELIVHIKGWDRVLALRSNVAVPLQNVVRATARPADAQFDGMKGLRLAGGYWPGSFAAGYFWVTGTEHEPRQVALETLKEAHQQLSSGTNDPSGAWAKARDATSTAIGEVERALAAEKVPAARKYLAFYDVHDPQKAIGIDIEHQNVSRMVIQVDDESPEDAAARIETALKALRGSYR